MKLWVQIAGLGIVAALGTSVFVAWRGVRREQAQLQEKLRSAEQSLQEANARQESRKAELEKQLAQMQTQQKAVQTPEQVVKALPDVLPLPTAVTLTDDAASTPEKAESAAKGADIAQPRMAVPQEAAGTKASDTVSKPHVEMPPEDLKPLYDFALGCKACQDELAAAQADLKDEKSKTETLSKERDDALKVARGGSVLQRVARAAKWFAIGAAAGAVAAKMAR